MRSWRVFFVIPFLSFLVGCGGASSDSIAKPLRYTSLKVYEDAEDGSVARWSVRLGEEGEVVNRWDELLQSRVIGFEGGGSYMIGAISGEEIWGDTLNRSISFRLNSRAIETIYVLVDTQEGARKIFYRTDTPARALKHSFEGGIHHGLGSDVSNGAWRVITRDLQADLQDAEPENRLLQVNGLIHNGGEGNGMDDLVLYNPVVHPYVTEVRRVEESLIIPIENETDNILQWRLKDFGGEPYIMSADPDERGTIRDPDAFEFRVVVDTLKGERNLIYRLGMEDLGIIEGGKSIEHALGDDRTIGAVWAGDDPMNELGLWQSVTRDLNQDIQDYEPQNRLLAVQRFEVYHQGMIDGVVMFSSAFYQRSAP